MDGKVTFNGGDSREIGQLVPRIDIFADKWGESNETVLAGTQGSGSFGINLYKKDNTLMSPEEFGIAATHEILHTVRIAHPWEVQQGKDMELKLTGIDKISFQTTVNTDKNISYNIMFYGFFNINGNNLGNLWQSKKPEYLSKSQLNLMLGEIKLQKNGAGIIPNGVTSPNDPRYLDYKNYWDPYGAPGKQLQETYK